MSQLYYTAPSDEVFIEVRNAARVVWAHVADHPQYLEEKIDRVNVLSNVQDNVMCIFAMFDSKNQAFLASMLSEESKKAIRDRLVDGGTPEEYINF